MTLRKPPHQLVATVLGAGTMGAQIAAHLANAGIRTHLLDIVPKGVDKGAPPAARAALALGAMKAMAKGKPAPFMDAAFAARIEPGNFDDDLERAVAESDLVIEAIIERLDIKQKVFARVAAAAPAHAVLASNTSGLSIAAIAGGLPESAARRIVGMHFFNPPRYMHLLEVVPSALTDPGVVRELSDFSDEVLGKGVVVCRDTPNFIGNRIGVAEMLLTNRTTFDDGYTIEEVDLLNGPLMGRPKTASFRLGDLVGIDVLGHVIRNLRDVLSAEPGDPVYDELHGSMVVHPTIEKMIERGMIGDKTGKGFYRKTRDAKGKRKIESLDLETLEYRARQEPELAELADVVSIRPLAKRIAAAVRVEGRAGEFLRRVYLPLLNYAANRTGQICDTPRSIDDALRWGFAWKLGPFEMWDAIGVAWGARQLESMGVEPAAAVRKLLADHGPEATWYRRRDGARTVYAPRTSDAYEPISPPAGVIVLDATRQTSEIERTKTASLNDLGDGVACVEFRSKMNIFDAGVIELMRTVHERLDARGGFRALVIGNQGDNFSAGADARQILANARERKWDAVDAAVAEFQDMFMALRHGPIPVVAAPHGMTLGGGAECTLSCAAVEAGAELYMGLVEAGIGLIPAGGGLKEMCRRASAWAVQVPDGDPYPFVRRAFENAGQAKVSTSAHHARAMGLLSPADGVTFHRARVIANAKRRALALADGGWIPPDPSEPIHVVGAPQGASFMLGAQLFHWGRYASAHDKLIGEKIAHVLSGGMTPQPTTVTAQHLLDLEREAFISLCGEEKTQARIQHTLETGKPLRN